MGYKYYEVSSGVTSTGLVLNEDNVMDVSSGGMAIKTTLNYIARMNVEEGGIANSTVVNFGGEFCLFSGGTANNTTVNDGGSFEVGGIANGIVANDGEWTLYAAKVNVISGGTATNVTINSGCELILYTGGVVSSATIKNSGFCLFFGGLASTVNLSGRMELNSCTASKVKVDGGSLYVSFGGNAVNTEINKNGNLYLTWGGVANSTTVNSSGSIHVSSGGTADGFTIKNLATLNISSGGKITGKMSFQNGATISADPGAIVDFDLRKTTAGAAALVTNLTYVTGAPTFTLTVAGTEAYGVYKLASGAAGFDKTITVMNTSGGKLGTLTVGSGRTIIGDRKYTLNLDTSGLSVTIGDLVDMTGDLKSEADLTAGMLGSGVNVLSGGSLNVLNGGSASMTTINSKGIMYVISGGNADGVTANSGGDLYVSSGGTATQIVENGGYVNVSDGATVTFIPNSFGGSTFSDRNWATIHSGTTGTDLTAGKDGLIAVVGGIAQNITVGSSGTLSVNDGGTADNVTVNQGFGRIYVQNSGTVNSATVSSGTFYISSGGTANSTTVSSGSMQVSRDGVASNTTISGGRMYVGAGGVANTTTVSGGVMSVDGVASNISIHATGKLYISGRITGKMTFETGATVSAYNSRAILDFDLTQTAPGADALVSNLAPAMDQPFTYTLTVSGTQANGKYKLAEGAAGFNKTISVVNTSGVELGTLTVGQTANIDGQDYKLTLDGGSLGVTIGAAAPAVDLTGDLSSEFELTSGMIGSNVNILNGGELYVLEGATADTVAVNPGGYLGVYSGGSASGIVAEEGACLGFTIAPDTYMQGTYAGRAFEVTDNTANGVTVPSGGWLFASDGGKATDTTVESGGYFELDYGCEANGVAVASGGSLNAVGSASGIVAEEGAYLEFYVAPDAYAQGTYGGSAFEIDSSVSGYAVHTGRLNLYEDGTADDVSVESGGELIIYGGTATNIVENGGYVTILDDAVVTFAAHEFTGGTVQSPRTVTAHSGTIVTDTTLESEGVLEIHEGGIAKNTTVNAEGCLVLEEGGIAKNITVNDGGFVEVSNNGKLTGKLTFESGATLYAYVGAILDFDLTQTAPGADALMNGVAHALVTAGFLYTLTVDGTEAAGDYKLAEEAVDFDYDDVITVVNTSGEELGTLSVDGGTQTLGGRDYTLTLTDDDTLCVTLEGSAPAPGNMFFEGDFNGDLFDTLAVESGSTVTIYQNGEAWGLGVTLDPGWTVVGTGDFSGDGLDDFLRVNTEGYVVGEMSNGNGTFSPQVLNLKNAGWEILGTGDFNGNGTDDVLIANPTGASETVGLLGYWESGVTWTLINGYSPEWEMVATGDYNGDGKCDMLWKNSFVGDGGLTYNAYCTWIVDDPVDWRMVSVANPDEWNFLCSGDFNADGMNDIAMINDVGVVGIWGVTDGYLSSWSILSAVTPEWQLAGVADFNADGTDDIAWSNTDTGLTGYWQIENKELASWQNIATLQAV